MNERRVMNELDEKVTAAYHLTRWHVETVKQHADANFDGNVSMALRRIITEWRQLKGAQMDPPMMEATK